VKWDGETSLEPQTVHPNGRTCTAQRSAPRAYGWGKGVEWSWR
jgi:hypothetical protein